MTSNELTAATGREARSSKRKERTSEHSFNFLIAVLLIHRKLKKINFTADNKEHVVETEGKLSVA